MRTNLRFAGVLAASLLACETDVRDLNNPGLDELQSNPTPSAVSSVATGLLIGARDGIARPNGYVSLLGVVGRESYDLDAGDPRFVTELIGCVERNPPPCTPALDPGTPAIGGNFWVRPYANIRNANILLNALPRVPGFTDTQKAATIGFAKTIQALDFLQVVNAHDDPPVFHGVPIDVGTTGTTLAPMVAKDQVFARIAQLLDDGAASLQSGGAKFPFPLSSGFAGFNTPATFLKANRALKARVEVYRGNFASALTALSQSFLDPAAQLTLGVYHAYRTGPGDL